MIQNCASLIKQLSKPVECRHAAAMCLDFDLRLFLLNSPSLISFRTCNCFSKNLITDTRNYFYCI
jgi:hypothetical protein